ncbi:MAG TPA: hypothetical protein VEW71_01570 [Allosphingosinicella sp.]|nr:hypothetical protein [Allosphingosinicella sp.]
MDKSESTFSRRGLLMAGGAIVAVGALTVPFRQKIAQSAKTLFSSQPRIAGTASLASGSHEQWQALVGSVFAVGGGVRIRLAGVRALQSSGVRPRGLARDRAFVAVFDTLAGATLPGDLIYSAGLARSAPFQIFLSAADSRTPGRMLAVFN